MSNRIPRGRRIALEIEGRALVRAILGRARRLQVVVAAGGVHEPRSTFVMPGAGPFETMDDRNVHGPAASAAPTAQLGCQMMLDVTRTFGLHATAQGAACELPPASAIVENSTSPVACPEARAPARSCPR